MLDEEVEGRENEWEIFFAGIQDLREPNDDT